MAIDFIAELVELDGRCTKATLFVRNRRAQVEGQFSIPRSKKV